MDGRKQAGRFDRKLKQKNEADEQIRQKNGKCNTKKERQKKQQATHKITSVPSEKRENKRVRERIKFWERG